MSSLPKRRPSKTTSKRDEISEDEFRQLLKIDKDRLDRALIQQAEIFYRVSSEHSLACSLRDQAYENIKMVDADLNLKIRSDHAKSGDKVTETGVAAEVLSSQEHSEAVMDHLAKRKRADDLAAMRESWLQRSYMLKELVQLYISNYYSDNSVSSESSATREFVSDARRARIAKAYKERSADGN